MNGARSRPCLSYRPGVGEALVRVELAPRPFRIGRSREAELVIGSPKVSKLHAEIDRRGGTYVVRDLGSRNGTFVNGTLVEGEHPLEPGDVVHIAHRELCFELVSRAELGDDATLAGTDDAELASHRGMRDLYRILTGRAVRAVFQPIVALTDGRVIGFEALGRNALPSTTYEAAELFALAQAHDKAIELSRIMRAVTLGDAPGLPDVGSRLFLNVHPAEMSDRSFLAELARAREVLGENRALVAEIHESAVTDLSFMRSLRAELTAMGVELAYDDFGAGRSRLMELAEVPPDFLKLDMSLVRGIDQSPGRLELVAALTRVLDSTGTRVVAEGIETASEHAACLAAGCELGQGFLIRHPMSADALREPA